MSIQLAFFTTIARKAEVEEKYAGGVVQFENDWRDFGLLEDDYLLAFSAMGTEGHDDVTASLAENDIDYIISCFEEVVYNNGEWLEVRKDGDQAIGWLKGTEPGELRVFLPPEFLTQQTRAGENDTTSFSSRIDYVAEKVSQTESLVESAFSKHRESPTPRALQIILGLLSVPLSAVLALGTFGFSTSIIDGTVSDWQSFVALAVIAGLSAFFAMVAYRLLLGQPRAPDGHLFSPAFMIAFGFLFSAVSAWMLIDGRGDSFGLLFGLGALSVGLTWRARSKATSRNAKSPSTDSDGKL